MTEIAEEHREGNMDFIERIFGVAPDGGTGSLEWAFLLVPLIGAWLLLKYRPWTRQR
jgi:hypothetical protein